jgi:prepilin-type N-terminal cleavage/methylation domain-containing protein
MRRNNEPNLFMRENNTKKSTKKNKKGFTLIELLIVVAIIAILAAIAIPQFSQYRIKAYNAAAVSDLRNAKTAEEVLFSDFQAYGETGHIFTTSPATITTWDTNNNARTVQVSLSNNVHISARTDAPGKAGGHYLIYTKHLMGDRMFAAENDAPTIYWTPAATNTGLVDPGTTSTAGNDITSAGYTPLKTGPP